MRITALPDIGSCLFVISMHAVICSAELHLTVRINLQIDMYLQ
ncbi:hypothetical protein LJR153_006015 [Paenibacillus sp. LjRoot153]